LQVAVAEDMPRQDTMQVAEVLAVIELPLVFRLHQVHLTQSQWAAAVMVDHRTQQRRREIRLFFQP